MNSVAGCFTSETARVITIIGGLSRRRLRAYFVVFAIARPASQRVFCNNLNFAILDQIVGNGTRARVFFPRLSAVVKSSLLMLWVIIVVNLRDLTNATFSAKITRNVHANFALERVAPVDEVVRAAYGNRVGASLNPVRYAEVFVFFVAFVLFCDQPPADYVIARSSWTGLNRIGLFFEVRTFGTGRSLCFYASVWVIWESRAREN